MKLAPTATLTVLVAAAIALSGCSGSTAPATSAPSTAQSTEAAPSASSDAAAGSSSSAATDTTVYENDSKACSAVISSLQTAQPDMTSALSGDSTKAVAAIEKVVGTAKNAAGQVKNSASKDALNQLAAYFENFVGAIQSKDTDKLQQLQKDATASDGTLTQASQQIAKCVMGQ